MTALLNETSIWAIGRLLYWLMPVLLLGLATCLLHHEWLGSRGRGRARLDYRKFLGLVSAMLLTASCLTLVSPRMRIQLDESVIVGLSKTMHERRAALCVTRALPGEETRVLDKRPPLFSFLTSVLHDARGFAISNAFAINAVVLTTLLTLVFVAAVARFGIAAALAAQLAVLGAPIILLRASSAGLELLSGTLFVALILAAFRFNAKPSARALALLCSVGLLYCYTRQEAAVAWLCCLAASLWLARRSFKMNPRALVLLACSGVLLVPLLAQLAFAFGVTAFETNSGPVLSLRYVPANAWAFASLYLDPRLGSPFAGLFDLMALVAIFMRPLSRSGEGRQRRWIVLAATAPLLAAPLAWFYGNASELVAPRLYLPLALLGALGPLALHGRFPKKFPALAALAVAAAMLAAQLHSIRSGQAEQRLRSLDITNELEELFPRFKGERSQTLFVSEGFCPYLVLYGFSCLDPSQLKPLWPVVARYRPLLLETGVDRLFYFGPDRGRLVSDAFELTPYAKRERPEKIVISRVSALR